MKLALWSPGPPDSLALLSPHLASRMDVVWVCEGAAPAGVPHARPDDAPDADLSFYNVADSPAHAFAFRAARERPGVVLLQDWPLLRLLAQEMSRPETRRAAVREMQRAYGEEGLFVARMVGRGLGGELLPALFPLNDRLLEASVGLVALTEEIRRRCARRLGEDRTFCLPLHLLASPDPVSPGEARRELGVPDGAVVVAAARPDSFRLSALTRVTSRMRDEFPDLRLLIGTSAAETPATTSVPDLGTMAAAADVVVALTPTTGGAPAGLAEAIAARRALVLSAGCSAVADLQDSSAVFVEPGRNEEAELEAFLRHLLHRPDLRDTLGRLAADDARRAADPAGLAETLVSFLHEIQGRKESILAKHREAREREETLLGFLTGEVEGGARSLGLHGLDLGLSPLFEALLRTAR